MTARSGGVRRTRGARRKKPQTGKAAEIVALVEALTSGIGAADGAVLGSGVAGILAEAYDRRGARVPPWVTALIRYYGVGARKP